MFKRSAARSEVFRINSANCQEPSRDFVVMHEQTGLVVV